MKKFHILDGFCHYDMSADFERFDLSHVTGILIVDAPDYVFEGWGYDDTKNGDERFIKPVPPEGWLYDDNTGTFYPEDGLPPYTEMEQLQQEITDLELSKIEQGQYITDLELMITEGKK